MNWLDFMLVIINTALLVFGIVSIVLAIINRDDGYSEWGLVALTFWIFYISLGWAVYGLPFVVLDRGSGNTVGTITSVDKNFFGTTAVYVKTSETSQEKYCIEDEGIAHLAKALIDKKVKISYGERVGIYSTGKCHQAPIDKIELLED